MSREKILVVDDNASNLKLMEAVLASAGYEVHCAVDAEDAIKAIASVSPRLIMMDVQLPGIDGLELTRRLKMDPSTGDILIVATTAYAMNRDRQRALDAGCDEYVSKPIDTRALPGIVSELLESAATSA